MNQSVVENAAEKNTYWGLCPVCHAEPRWYNISTTHWLACDEHRVRWCVGCNLVSSWREETEEDWKKNGEKIGDYEVVKPYECWK